VFGTAVQSTPFSLAGGKAAFGSIRPGAARTGFDDDDDDDDSMPQRIELREGSISLEQVPIIVSYLLFLIASTQFLR
jgi:hypothetical protein